MGGEAGQDPRSGGQAEVHPLLEQLGLAANFGCPGRISQGRAGVRHFPFALLGQSSLGYSSGEALSSSHRDLMEDVGFIREIAEVGLPFAVPGLQFSLRGLGLGCDSHKQPVPTVILLRL